MARKIINGSIGIVVTVGFALSLVSPVAADERKQLAFEVVDRNAQQMTDISDSIYYFGELGMQEFETARLMTGLLEDVVIFVHDMERVLRQLNPFQQRLIAMNVLEEYSLREVAKLLPCPLRTVEREVPDTLDVLSRALLESGLIKQA
jgi:DNA-directed RNA polymerase specialized sigma24 family protein